MELADLLREVLIVDCDGVWENERIPKPVRMFEMRLHSVGLSRQEVVAVFEWLDVDHFHRGLELDAYTLGKPRRPATAHRGSPSTRNRSRPTAKKKWLYAVVDTDSKSLLKIDVFSRRGTDLAAAFLHCLTECHDILDAEFSPTQAGISRR